MQNTVTADMLAEFAAAWNRHDIDALMGFMSEDCVFETVGGPDACGSRHTGADAVRAAFAAAWKNFPDAQWNNGRHWVAGDRGVSECTFTGTAADGSRVEADMVDIFTFQDGKIRVKNAFRKQRPALPARA
ncbi:Ketosteroid isomerase-related protein [Achromobacter denitrificans]|nr:Ketosteroid isomerase-related protein [Achromobacter denitrificans]